MVYVGIERFFVLSSCNAVQSSWQTAEGRQEVAGGAEAWTLQDHVLVTQFGELTRRHEGVTAVGLTLCTTTRARM